MNRFDTRQPATRRRLTALAVAGTMALLTLAPRARAAAPTPDARPAAPVKVMDLGTIEGIVVTPHGNYSQSEWDARQRRLASLRARSRGPAFRLAAADAPARPGPLAQAGIWSVALPSPGRLTISLPTPHAGF